MIPNLQQKIQTYDHFEPGNHIEMAESESHRRRPIGSSIRDVTDSWMDTNYQPTYSIPIENEKSNIL